LPESNHQGERTSGCVGKALPSWSGARVASVENAVRRAFRVIAARVEFRVVDLSLQRNHLHQRVEADDRESPSRGMQSFEI
jgi:REP element-mobilizing transposase RayT